MKIWRQQEKHRQHLSMAKTKQKQPHPNKRDGDHSRSSRKRWGKYKKISTDNE